MLHVAQVSIHSVECRSIYLCWVLKMIVVGGRLILLLVLGKSHLKLKRRNSFANRRHKVVFTNLDATAIH